MGRVLEVEFGATAETTTFTVRGMVRASMDALVTAEGSCSYKASKGFPKKPKTKIICAKGFCNLHECEQPLSCLR